MVSPQSFVIADVGCDHAYVSIALIRRRLADKVIAMDVRKGPLDIAKRNVKEAGHSDVIDIRLGDGLEKLQPGEADVIIIAGMGGLLVKGILERGMNVLSYDKKRPILILQPQSDLKEVRMFLMRCAYHIVCETMLIEEGKYYTVIKAVPVNGLLDNVVMDDVHNDSDKDLCVEVPYSEEELLYGRYNIMSHSEVLYEYLKKEKEVLKQILDKVQKSVGKSINADEKVPESTRLRLESIQQELALNERALQHFR